MGAFTEILSLFTSESINTKTKKEDFSEAKVSYVFDLQKIPRESGYPQIIGSLNSRDTFHLSILKDDEVIGNFTNRNNSNFTDYIATLNNGLVIGDNIEIIITIEKNKRENTISVYNLDWFVNYLNSLSFLTFLNIFERYLDNDSLKIENQESDLEGNDFHTKTISLRNFNDKIEKSFRKIRIHNATTLCHWDIGEKLLLPDDFYPINTEQGNQELTKVFQKVCLLYTTMFIFDYLSVKENDFLYKLNGYKTFGEQIATKKIESINIDTKSFDLFYKIYKWIYSGGNTNDKISIARNIISLNYNPEILEIQDTAFDAILSNYKIYERQNVKQYIEVRNKLSKILIDLQGKIDKIVDGFSGDYKKNIITLLSFFISVIVIRVVSKGDFIGGFTTEIIILSYSFLVISIGLLIYSRWEFSKRVEMFDKHYEQLKDRYKELLSEDELNKIFNECNPKNRKTKSFVYQQRRLYTILWICSVLSLAIALIIIFLMNNCNAICDANNFIKLIICCIKSI
jgi:hypothetical protein